MIVSRSSPGRTSSDNPCAPFSTQRRPDLSVIIVNYNVCDFLEQALDSLQQACTALKAEIFVVDNNSSDDSVATVRKRFPNVQLIANTQNVGFSQANNQAIEKARGRYLLVLNPDTIVQEDTLSTLVGFMDTHPSAGAVGCQILNPDGTFAPESRRAFPTPSTAFYRMTGLSRLFPHSKRFGRYNMTYLPRHKVAEVDALSGSCMMVRHTALYFAYEQEQELRQNGCSTNDLLNCKNPSNCSGAGLFDEDFFMYGEDLDWCYRIQQAGWKILYTPATQILHYKGESTKKGDLQYVRHFYRAMLQFTQKHFSGRYPHLFALLIKSGIIVHAGLALFGTWLKSLVLPFLDFALTYGTLTAAAAWYQQTPLNFSFYSVAAPLYAMITVASIAGIGTYRQRYTHSLQQVLYGVVLGSAIVTALPSYLPLKAVPLAGFAVLMLLLVSMRGSMRCYRKLRQGLRRALMVGHPAEAERLAQLLNRHPQPAFRLVGYIDAVQQKNADHPPLSSPPCLGQPQHLYDLIRRQEINDVIFASGGLSNRLIFHMMQELQPLPVQFRIFVEGRKHLIGKASIDDLSDPSLVTAEKAIGPLRSRRQQRVFDIFLACLGLLLHPLIVAATRLTKKRWNPIFRQLAKRTRQLPAVIQGEKTLVGNTNPLTNKLPEKWQVSPGVFSIVDTFVVAPKEPTETQRAYWFYARKQSVSMDVTIVYRALKSIIAGR